MIWSRNAMDVYSLLGARRIGKTVLIDLVERCLVVAVVLLSLQGSSVAYAKREAPTQVPPVDYEGVRYKAPNHDGRRGYVQAWDIDSGKMLWEVTIFRNRINPFLEEDVQWVFIEEMRIEKGYLVVISERQVSYRLDLKTRAVGRLKKTPSATQP